MFAFLFISVLEQSIEKTLDVLTSVLKTQILVLSLSTALMVSVEPLLTYVKSNVSSVLVIFVPKYIK